jgi:hypothetical protein
MIDEEITENTGPSNNEFARYVAGAVAVFTAGLVWRA